MPIRRVAATPSQEREKTSPAAAEKEADATPETADAAPEAAAAEEDKAASSASAPAAELKDAPDQAQPTENGEKADEGLPEKTGDEGEKKELKDVYKFEKAKVKKIKKTIPAWASVTANKNIPVAKFSGPRNKLDDILIEAIKATNKAGVSYRSVIKYMVKKYPDLELERKKFFIKKAMKKHLEKGTIKQLKGKGLSGSFAIGKQSTSKKTAGKTESLGDALPLIFTRLCEPKEASFFVIKKYLEQHFPSLNIESRPEVLKAALGKAVERGQLDQITGKGARGTFQLKRTGNQVLLKGGVMEDAITAAITAMNEPKTCSITTLRKYLLDANKDSKEYRLVASLKRTLTKCKVLGWMEQITGHGFNGTYQLSFPFYPSPLTLYPEKFEVSSNKKEEAPKKRQRVETSSDDDDDDDDEPPSPKRRVQKRPAPKSRPLPAKKSAVQSKPKGKPAAKSPAKKVASSASKSAAKARKQAASKKEAPKATPVKRAAPAKKPKTPAVKKMTKRGGKASAPKESPQEKAVTKAASKQEPAPKRGAKRSKTQESSPKQPAAKKAAGGSSSSSKQSTRKSKRGKY